MKNKQNIFLRCKDFTVSGEIFELEINEKLDMLITYPKPNKDDLANYYESEDYISHTDSKKSIMDKMYQIVKNYSIHQKIKLINSFDSGARKILDIGCGTGDFLVACKTDGWSIFGVEPSAKARDLTFQKLIKKNSSVENTIEKDIEDILEYQDKTKQYDVITMWHVLEHVPNLSVYIKILKNLLKPNGVLIIAVPNFKSYDADYYKEYWAAYDVPRHLSHFSPKSIKILFEEIQMEVLNILPMKFDAYYISLLSEKYKSGASNPFKAFYRGFISNLKARSTKQYSSLIYIIKNVR